MKRAMDQLLLKFQPAHLRHPNVSNQASEGKRWSCGQELRCRSKASHRKGFGFEKYGEGIAHCLVVIDDIDAPLTRHRPPPHGSLAARPRERLCHPRTLER